MTQQSIVCFQIISQYLCGVEWSVKCKSVDNDKFPFEMNKNRASWDIETSFSIGLLAHTIHRTNFINVPAFVRTDSIVNRRVSMLGKFIAIVVLLAVW